MANSSKTNGSTPAGITTQPLPASQKIYVHSHHHPEIPVAMRAVRVGDSHGGNGGANGPIMIYDTSGPYTDPTTATDIRQGLRPLRLEWIKARGDVEEVPGYRYLNGKGKNGQTNGAATERFPDASRRPVLRAQPGCNVSQMHYAKRGVITPEMEYIAIRENIGREQALENGANGNGRTHAGQTF